MKTLEELPERRVAVGGGEIAYWVVGEGQPLLTLTGLAAPAAAWSIMPSVLASQGYKVIAIDNRDAGRSSSFEGVDYSIADLAADAVKVLDESGVASAYVFGVSMGGMIAQELALGSPERVKRLMLVSTGPGGAERIDPDLGTLAKIFSTSHGTGGGFEELFEALCAPGFGQRRPELIKMIASKRSQYGFDADAFNRQFQAILGFAAWDRLDKLSVPTLVLHGDADPLVPLANGQKLASRIPGAELRVFPGVGHLVPLEEPAGLLQAIREFFPSEGMRLQPDEVEDLVIQASRS